jgi:hypothetical protein
MRCVRSWCGAYCILTARYSRYDPSNSILAPLSAHMCASHFFRMHFSCGHGMWCLSHDYCTACGAACRVGLVDLRINITFFTKLCASLVFDTAILVACPPQLYHCSPPGTSTDSNCTHACCCHFALLGSVVVAGVGERVAKKIRFGVILP